MKSAASVSVGLLLTVSSVASGASWLDDVLTPTAARPLPVLRLIRQDHEKLEYNRSILRTPLAIGSRTFQTGLGTHSVSHIRITSPVPLRTFSSWVGVDRNERTAAGRGSVVFTVSAEGRELHRSPVMRGAQEPRHIEVDLGGAQSIDLHVLDAGDGPSCDHANWAEACLTLGDGTVLGLEQLPSDGDQGPTRYPFAFTYTGTHSDELLTGLREEQVQERRPDGAQRTIRRWRHDSGLVVTCEEVRYAAFDAAEWLLSFENVGTRDSTIVADVSAMNVTLNAPLAAPMPYRLYRTGGGPARPDDFEFGLADIGREHPQTLSAGQGRSSHQTFPFFKVDTSRGSVITAIGWSGMWNARLTCPDDRRLHISAGLEKTHFLLHPGEKVRSPRILMLFHEGDTWEANARFRQLLQKHYIARRAGEAPLPTLFCNTCFTRGGGWLNECNAENQISLINAYAPLGLEALLTDAGWFEGGWPAGAGNWNPRKDAYPKGMAPVARAAKEKGMIYGLWFEPERVVAGTDLHRNHPEWLLRSKAEPEGTYLLNFGLPAVQEYFFNIVADFMKLPGFRFYRQDFNMDPLPYWRFSDAPDRVGVTEMKYIEGLYAYWDRIAEAWPDSLREECASGGNRIDLETVMRMHLHQKTDYWFDNEVDQASLWGLSQYLPNGVVVAHLDRMDDYSFHSTMASSLCMGWIADAKDFDVARGKALLDQYLKVRHLLTGAWYPLLPYSRSLTDWSGSQFHRQDLEEGLLLIFRRAQSPYRTVDVALRGLSPEMIYAFTACGPSGERVEHRLTGRELMAGVSLTLPERRSSELVVYRKADPGVRAKPLSE